VLSQEPQCLFLGLKAQQHVWICARRTIWIEINDFTAVLVDQTERRLDSVREGEIPSSLTIWFLHMGEMTLHIENTGKSTCMRKPDRHKI
jgi:hypothetical protein